MNKTDLMLINAKLVSRKLHDRGIERTVPQILTHCTEYNKVPQSRLLKAMECLLKSEVIFDEFSKRIRKCM